MKVAIVRGATRSNDAVRGIGVHNSELFKAFRKSRNLNIIDQNLSLDDNFSKFDVVHFTSFRPFFRSLPFTKPKDAKFILTIHDLIPLIYPKVYKPGIKGKINYILNKFLVKKFVDAIITISETSKKDIIRFLGVDSKIVHVVYLAPKEIFKKRKVNKKYDLPKRFALYTGDVNYNKNIPNLIKACEAVGIPLVIAGKQALEIEKMDLAHPEAAHLAGLSFENVIRLGFVDDDTLCDLFNLAEVYIQPSLYEGFGLPVLEAYACGTPIAVAKTQALVEILGKDLNYFNPNDLEDIAHSILNPNVDIKLPRSYSWEKTAKETLSVYEKYL